MANKPIPFRCRTCGDAKLFEVMTNVIVTSECTLDGEYGVLYDEQSNEDGQVLHYICGQGHVVMDNDDNKITEGDELCQFVGDHPTLSRDDVIELIADRLREVDTETLLEEFNNSYPSDDLKDVGGVFVRGNPDED